ncbi:uncharacterized protein DEA37_0013339 [Paragonimus westermani]|uniref:RNA-binding protein Luc7-like 2 n=1 Tax=Paragonimus westermani TaxID=34504 RepID=A0A5J4P1S5_9TREM|nr:uncharacterized protein DEA37_0013339 [Paragonimus westermani]
MSATDQIRALLDEFMGTTRNDPHFAIITYVSSFLRLHCITNNCVGGEPPISFEDTRVCKSYLLDSCPHEILAGTRMDLGACSLIHDPALKADYRREAERKKFAYELDALAHLQMFIRDSDHRTELAKAKLRETQEELTDEAQQKAENLNALSEQIGTKLAKAEQLGADGHVDESLTLMKEVEQLNQDKAKCEAELRTAIPTSTYQQQKLRVCEVCSAYLGIHDNDRRLADHFGGKLHLGFIEIREKLAYLKAYVEENQIVRKRRFEGYSRSTFSREAEKYRESSRRKHRSSERRHRSRSRSRSRHHKQHSSRCSDRHSREHRHRSSKDRDGDRI